LRPVDGTENPADDNGGNQKCSFQADSFHSNLPCSQKEHLPTNLPIFDLFHGQSCGQFAILRCSISADRARQCGLPLCGVRWERMG
jgi:hypothetical protein